MNRLNTFSLLIIFFGSCFYGLCFNLIDKPIAHFFHHAAHSGFVYSFSQIITLLGDPRLAIGFAGVSIISSIAILFKEPQSKLANHLLMMSIAMLGAIFLEAALKYLLGRYRPEMLFQEGLYGFHYLSHQSLMNSTPSGHATRMFVLVTGFSLLWKRFTPLFILLGLLVCISRLVLEFHYVSDVFFGALLGTLVTLWVAKIYYSMTLSSKALMSFDSR